MLFQEVIHLLIRSILVRKGDRQDDREVVSERMADGGWNKVRDVDVDVDDDVGRYSNLIN